MTGVLGGAGLPAPFVWGVLGRRGSRALQACLVSSTLTRYPRLFADVSSQFFSYGESHPPPHPCFLRNSILETWCYGAAQNLGFHAQVSIRAPLSICIFFFPLFSLPFSNRMLYPASPLNLSRAQTYLAATSQGMFLSTFIFISLRLHLFSRCAQHLKLNPFAVKTQPRVPLTLGAGAFPGTNSVRLFCK